MKSPVAKRSIVVASHKTSVSLELAFWTGMKEISGLRNITLSELVGEIDRNPICRPRYACSSSTTLRTAPRSSLSRKCRHHSHPAMERELWARNRSPARCSTDGISPVGLIHLNKPPEASLKSLGR
jgi:predicted DNA-binding ribbon-helix-helix protein